MSLKQSLAAVFLVALTLPGTARGSRPLASSYLSVRANTVYYLDGKPPRHTVSLQLGDKGHALKNVTVFLGTNYGIRECDVTYGRTTQSIGASLNRVVKMPKLDGKLGGQKAKITCFSPERVITNQSPMWDHVRFEFDQSRTVSAPPWTPYVGNMPNECMNNAGSCESCCRTAGKPVGRWWYVNYCLCK